MSFPPTRRAGNQIVLFDGVCRLCNGWSRFIIRHDRAGRLKLCSMQSPAGQAILTNHGLPTERFDTLVYLEGPRAHVKSEAVLRVLGELPFPWRLLRVLALLPRPLRDWVYDRIARHRYRLFGRYDSCPPPRPEDRERFLGAAPACPASTARVDDTR